MKPIYFILITLLVLSSCKKDNSSRVDIYMLKSFTAGFDRSFSPAVNTITNAVLADTPLVANDEILFYTRNNYNFTLSKDIKSIIKDYGPEKAFAVTVDKQVIYCGAIHPSYMSSLPCGIAFIDPIINGNNEIRVNFGNISGLFIHPLDRRNDEKIVNAFKRTGRLR